MKKLALLTFVTASLFCPAAMADDPPAGPARAGTAEAMQCLTRQGPKGCERLFVGAAWISARNWVFHDPQRDFQRGKLVFSTYWGRASETNAYDMKAMRNPLTSEMD